MKVIVLTGMPGSGKSTAVDIAKSMDIPIFRMGEAIWAEVRSRGLNLQDSEVGRIATEMRKTHGADIWAQRTIEMISKAPLSNAIIIDGCRSPAEIDAFKAEFGEDLVILALKAPQKLRFERLISRGRKDDIRTIEDFKDRDERELGWGIGKVIENADIIIENHGTIEDTQRQTFKILRNYL